MKFDYDGLSYKIEFAREQRVPASSHLSVTRTYTTAMILQVLGPKEVKVLRSYTVGANHRDRFSYEAGRKYALALAMYDAPTKSGGAPLLGEELSREFRKAVWKAYHTRQGSLVAWKDKD